MWQISAISEATELRWLVARTIPFADLPKVTTEAAALDAAIYKKR